MVRSSGPMAANSKETSSPELCMATAFTSGKMVVNMKETTDSTRSTAKESTPTQMAASIRASGLTVFNTELDQSSMPIRLTRERASGLKASSSSGSSSSD